MRNIEGNSNISQKGRTMTEMISVLMIIGVLSIGILYGFQYGMFRYRVTQTLNQISAAVAGAKTINLKDLGISISNNEEGILFLPVNYIVSGVRFTDDPYYFRTPLNADIGIYRDTKGVWRAQIKFTELMSNHDCQALLASTVAEYGIGYNGRVYTQENLVSDSALLGEICRYYTKEE